MMPKKTAPAPKPAQAASKDVLSAIRNSAEDIHRKRSWRAKSRP